MLRRDSSPLCGPRHFTWSWVSSRVQGPSCKALLEERGPRLALEGRERSGGRGGLEEVLRQLRAKEGQLRQTFPRGGPGTRRGPHSSTRTRGGSQEALLFQLQPLLQDSMALHLRGQEQVCFYFLLSSH